MARPTKLAASLARGLEAKPSQVQGWLEHGYGPADDNDVVEHFIRLQPLMGTGRNGDVAVIKMASEGWPCLRLRDVLRSLQQLGPEESDSQSVDELIEYGMTATHLSSVASFLRSCADEAPDSLEGSAGHMPPEPDLSEIRARSSLLPLAMAVLAEPIEHGDMADFDQLMNVPISKLTKSTVPDLTPDDEAALMTATARIGQWAHQVPVWLEVARTEDLVDGVKAARSLLDALGAMGLNFDGDEEDWLWVGRLAPTAARLLTPLANLIEQFYLPLANGMPVPSGEQLFIGSIVGPEALPTGTVKEEE